MDRIQFNPKLGGFENPIMSKCLFLLVFTVFSGVGGSCGGCVHIYIYKQGLITRGLRPPVLPASWLRWAYYHHTFVLQFPERVDSLWAALSYWEAVKTKGTRSPCNP